MKKIILKVSMLTLFLLVSAAGYARPASDNASYTFTSGGIQRTYVLYVPDGLPDDAPLVVLLHGYGGRADPARYGMNETAARHGFAVCYPQGENDPRGKASWNVGYPSQREMTIDDVQFMEDLVGHVQREHGLGRRNVFCAGSSNGGEMCYQVSSQRPGLFRAVASVTGLMMQWLLVSDESTVPVPLLQVHGTGDKVSYWDGDLENSGGWGRYISVPLAVHYWAAKNKCTAHFTEPLPGKMPQHPVTLHRFTGGTGGSEVWLCEIEGGEHSWGLKYIDTNELVWRFFSKYVE